MRLVHYTHPRSLTARDAFSSPWAAGFQDEIDRVMNSALSNFFGEAVGAPVGGQPRVDLYEDKENFHFRAELPGLKREDIQVEAGDGVLTISGTRRSFSENGKDERKTEFSRSVSVPARIEEGRITARYADGILTVTLPKAEEIKPKRIAVQVK